MKPIVLFTHILFLFSGIEASEYPQRKDFPLFKVEDSSNIDDSIIDDIFGNSKKTQYSGAEKVSDL